MNPKIKAIFTNWKVILLIIFLIFAIVAIRPSAGAQGVTIRSVIKDSAASEAGIVSPKPTLPPLSRERIIGINNIPVKTIDDYNDLMADIKANVSFSVQTNKGVYWIETRYKTEKIVSDELENITVEETYEDYIGDNFTNVTINRTYEQNRTETKFFGIEPIGLNVYQAPTSNIRKGLELQGGTRVVLSPEVEMSPENMSVLLDNIKQRLNVFGLSDIVVREAGDLSGNQYIIVEIAGVNEEEVKELISKQGKFEAKIANKTVFKGGQDITYVCRTAQCSGIDPRQGCRQMEDGQWACRFMFSISMTAEAAERHADMTKDLDIVPAENGEEYLNESLILFLDNKDVDQLRIGAELRGSASTEISISGSGVGRTEQEAMFNTLQNMKRLQTILITGSLPVKLNIVKTDNISPVLGGNFVRNALFMGMLAILVVAIVVFIRYRMLKVAIPVVITSTSEVILLLGFAALVGWNLDLAAIAGIIIAVGTGVDHQVVIADETLKREHGESFSSGWKQKLKKAFFIIFSSYTTLVVAMVPLLFAGAGLLKGFALTTIVGATMGVFISRPAFAEAIEILLK